MGKLLVYPDTSLYDLQSVADVVYKRMRQKINLYVDLSFVSGEEIRSLNKEIRNVDSVTDVLSFPTLDDIRGKIIKKEDYPLDLDGNYIFIGSAGLLIILLYIIKRNNENKKRS